MATREQHASVLLLDDPPAVARPLARARPLALQRVLQVGLLATLFFGPLAFGAVEEWSRAVLQLAAAGLFLVWALGQGFSRRPEVAISPIYLPMAAFALLIVVQLAFGLTAYGFATSTEFWGYIACGLLFFTAQQCLREDSDLRLFVSTITVFGFLLALFAIVQDFSSTDKLYWLRPVRFGGWIYGPYVNHNHYAGLMELLTPIPLALALSPYSQGPKRALLAFAGVVMAGSIFLSGSRGGMAAFIVQTIFFAACLIAQRRGRRPALMLAAFLLLTFTFLIWFGASQISDRLATLHDTWRSDAVSGRWAIVRDSVSMFTAKPILGWGLGAFPIVYPQFRSFYTNLFVNQAHNDYVQVLVEMGVLGFAATLAFLALLYRYGLKRQREASGFSHYVRLAALVGCTGIVVHSLVDFNLHIPANAAWFFVLSALATARFRGPEEELLSRRPFGDAAGN
ncbi:MAG TPA: O-antigen ligase family protein [Terriglobales bacterium]|nr:O-antigen ligase family protein [Terriglobales bacterium]